MKLQHTDSKHLFGIVVFDYDEYKIDQSINSLKQIKYDENKYKIILSTKCAKKASELFAYVQDFKNNGIISELIITLDTNADIETEAYQKCMGATHIVKIKAGNNIDPDVFNQVNASINENNDLVSFEKNNVKIINFNTANDLYLDYNNFDALFEHLKQQETHKDLNEK